MNLNRLAKELCALETGKQEVNIAQMKEIIRCLGEILREMAPLEAIDLIRRIMK